MLYMYLILIVFLIAIAMFYAVAYKDYFHPLVIFYIPVGFSLLIFYFYFVPQGYSVSDDVIGLYASSMLSFFVGALPILVVGLWGRSGRRIAKKNDISFKPISKNIIFFILFLGTVGVVLNVYEGYNIALGGGANWAAYLRRATTKLHIEYSGRHLMLFMWLGVAFLAFYRRKWGIPRIVLLFFTFLWMLNSLVTMARVEVLMAIFVPLIASFYAQKYHFKQNPSVLPLITALIVFILCYFLMGMLTNKITDALVDPFMSYFSYQFMNVDKFALSKGGSYSGDTVFYMYKVMWQGITGENIFSGNEIVLGTFQHYNLFGAFGRIYLDFGAYGAQIFWLLLGCFVSLVHYMIQKGNVYSIIFYAFISQALMLSFFGGRPYSWVIWYYIAILLLMIHFIPKFRIHVRSKK